MSREVIDPAGFQDLFSRPERPDEAVLSVYLNVDQSRQSNLNRGFEKELRDLMASIRSSIGDAASLERFTRAAHHINGFVSSYEPPARGLALFFDDTDGFFWHKELQISVHNRAEWSRELLLRPLADAVDQFEPYGVVLIDRTHLRLFSVFLGEIAEVVKKTFGPGRVRHIKKVGRDHWGSSSQIQSKADEQIRINLRAAIKEVDGLVQSKHIQRLVLAGTPEITAELRDLLPKRLALEIIGSVQIAMDTSLADVLAASQPLMDEYERSTEEQTVKEVITVAAKTDKAVIGLGHTLKAVNSDRVWQLVYSEDFSSPGFECAKCGALFSVEKTSCSYCSAGVRPVANVVECAVDHAVRNGARIEVVTGEAAASLDSAGGMGAFLRARTSSLQL